MRLIYVFSKGEKFMNIKINSITLGGFKNIDRVDVELDNIISMLSINSYGKSNFLNAIIFGIDFIHQPTEIKSNMMDYDPYKPYNTKILFKDFSFEINLTYENNSDVVQVIYGYSFLWKRNEKEDSRVLNEYLKIKDNNSQKYTTFISRKDDKAFYKSSITGSCNKKINIENNDLVVNKIIAFDDLYYLDLVKLLNNMFVYVDKHFNTSSAYDIKPIIRKNISDYNLNDDTNIPRILFKIKNDYPDKFELIINTLKDIFPFIQDIEIVDIDIDNNKLNGKLKDNYIPANKVYFLVALDKNLARKIDFSDMSDGVRRVLLIFTTLVLADINKYLLVGIEEPENSLNPKILQRYLMALSNFTKNTKIIITSHSPYLINYLKPENIYLGLPNSDGVAYFSKIKEKSVDKLLKDANNMDMLIGDYLFDLMSGDEEDLKTMIRYVE